MNRHISIITMLAMPAIALSSCTDDSPDIQRPYVDYSGEAGGNGASTYYMIVNTQRERYDYQNEISIDAATQYQTIEGFGASDCWLGQFVGKYYSETQKREMAQALFSQDTTADGKVVGIGLSIWRVNLGAGSAEQGDDSGISSEDRRAESFMSGSNYDWSKCEGQQYFMRKAKEMGCEKIHMFSNSPLVEYTRNGKARSTSGTNANIKDDGYEPFAQYMADVCRHFADEGINIDYISPCNEPQYNWNGDGQEGSPWQNSEIYKITHALNEQLNQNKLSTQIVLTESGQWGYLTTESDKGRSNQYYAFFDPASDYYVGDLIRVKPTMSAHSYYQDGSWAIMRDSRTKALEAAKKYNCTNWQTEWSMLVNGQDQYLTGGEFMGFDEAKYIDIALYMSKVIHSDMVWANCASWSYWTVWGQERWDQKNRFYLIKLGSESVDDYANDYGDILHGGMYALNTNLYVLGNYSRFIRPGYKRVKIDLEEDYNQKFFASAYISPDGNTLAAVFTNMTDKKIGLSTTFSGFSTPSKVSKYITGADSNLKRVNVSDANTVIPAQSVVTVVYTK